MTTEEETPSAPSDTIQMTTDIVASYVSKNTLTVDELASLIKSVHASLAGLAAETQAVQQKPAVPVSRSITDDYIVCLEDGARLKILKRYIRTHFGLSPEEYRTKWGLPESYPMVAPAYARRRSELAKKIGLGTRK